MTDRRITLLPSHAIYSLGTPVVVDVLTDDNDEGIDGALIVFELGEVVACEHVTSPGPLTLSPLPAGSYGVELVVGGVAVARTAVQIATDVRSRLRYGFVANYAPAKRADDVVRFARRLHLNGIQFYDWAYRHADLLGGGDMYQDALDQPISLETVRALVDGYRAVGADALGYAAVYAVGTNEWPAWEQHAILRPDGTPWSLGDFLLLVDPAAPEWVVHLSRELQAAVEQVGFAGFHLDQYGYPKGATDPSGAVVDVADSFVALIEALRNTLPAERLVFNNVNDFPTVRTASLPQDAVYIEPWVPNNDLASLAAIAKDARAASNGQPVVVAAYQHLYDHSEPAAADLAAAFTMAVLYSHGATQLLAGEDGRVLVDPYYVRNHVASPSTLDFLARWYDFLVEHDRLLMDPAIIDVTRSYVGEYNGDLDVAFAGAPVSGDPTPGTVWRRVTQTGDGLVVHLINLVSQTDTLWDTPRETPGDPGPARLTFRPLRGRTPRVRIADPDGLPRLVELDVAVGPDGAAVHLPPLHVWQVLHVAL